MTTDIQDIEARLLSQGYPETVLFADLAGQQHRSGGREVEATCPFCGKAKHFYYSTETPLWHCHKCGESGNWFDYLEKRQGKDFKEALHELARAAGVTLDHVDQKAYQAYSERADLLEAAQAFCVDALSQPEGQAVYTYLIGRGYPPEDIQAMGLGAYTDQQALLAYLQEHGYSRQALQEAGLLKKQLTNRVTLLWRDLAGRPVGLVARAIQADQEPKYLYSAGFEKSAGLLGLERARRSKQAILVEGVLDALYIAAHGLPIVAIGGTDLSDRQIEGLQKAGVKALFLALDQDQAGRAGIDRAITKLLLSGSGIKPYVVNWPEEFKDPDELIRGYRPGDPQAGLSYFEDCLKRASGWPAWKVSYTLSKYDLDTDRGKDAALEEALAFCVGIADPIQSRAYQEALRKALGLQEGDLAYQLAQYRQRAAEQQTKARLQALQHDLQAKTAEGDFAGAELALEAGLLALRRMRGAVAPEPYLLADLEQDLLSMTNGLHTGYTTFGDVIRVPEGAITILAGRPGHGKTSFLLNLLINLLLQYGEHKRFYFYSYEEARSRLALKLIMILAGVVLQAETNQGAYLNYLKEKRGSHEIIEKAIKTFESLTRSGRLWLLDRPLAAEDLAASIDDLATRGDTGAVFVDYIQKIPVREARPTRQAEVARASELLREQAVKHNLPIIVGAQFNRQAGKGKEPKLEELREAGDLEQDANLVLALYNQAEEEAQESGSERPQVVDLKVTVLKNRGGPAGERFTLCFNQPVLRIEDPPHKGKRSNY